MASGTRAAGQRSYDDFEPTTEWKREPAADTLLVYLPGFRKEQIKVQVTSSRQLRISGERPSGNNSNKWSRFKMEMPIGSNYDTNEINAKFDKGVLYVKHPKVIIAQPAGVANKQQLPPQRPAAPVPPPPAAVAASPPSRRAQDQKPVLSQPGSNAAPAKEASVWKVPPTEPSVSRPPRAETKNLETGMEAEPDEVSGQEKMENKETTARNGPPKGEEVKKEEGSGSWGSKPSPPLMKMEKYKEAMSGLGMKVMEMRQDRKRLLNLGFAVLAAVVVLLYLRNAAKSLMKFRGAADTDDDQFLL